MPGTLGLCAYVYEYVSDVGANQPMWEIGEYFCNWLKSLIRTTDQCFLRWLTDLLTKPAKEKGTRKSLQEATKHRYTIVISSAILDIRGVIVKSNKYK